jgi:predicted small lipoprotein YifL
MLHSKISDQTVILIVKSSPAFYIPRFGMVVLSVAAGALLAGCGQPGPLYLPKLPPKVKPATATSATPATPATPAAKPVTPDSPVTDDNAVQPSTILPPVLPQ